MHQKTKNNIFPNNKQSQFNQQEQSTLLSEQKTQNYQGAERKYNKRLNEQNNQKLCINLKTFFWIIVTIVSITILRLSMKRGGLTDGQYQQSKNELQNKQLKVEQNGQVNQPSEHDTQFFHKVESQQDEQDFAIQFKQRQYENPDQSQYKAPDQALLPNPWAQVVFDSPVTDKYFFKVPIQRLLQLSRPDKFFGIGLRKSMAGMSYNQLQLSLNLLYVVHNVDFKGQVKIQMAPYERSLQEKQSKIKRILQAQEQFYDSKYSFLQHINSQLPFCLVTPSYKNVQSKLYLRNLDSIFMQKYDNYHVVYIDDASPDQTGQYVKTYIKERNIPSQKIKVIINQKNIFALNNIYNAIHYHCKAGEIAVLIDGDDAFVGRQVLGLYNSIYHRMESAFVYSNYLHVMYNQKAVVGGSSRAITPSLLKNSGIRKTQAFFTSHLLTFYVDLFRKIRKSDLSYQNGTFFKYAYDVAMCTPMLQMIGQRVYYIPELTYQYRYDTGQNDPSSGQLQVTTKIYQKEPYDLLAQLPFIDDRQNYLKWAPQYTQQQPEA